MLCVLLFSCFSLLRFRIRTTTTTTKIITKKYYIEFSKLLCAIKIFSNYMTTKKKGNVGMCICMHVPTYRHSTITRTKK